MSDDHQYRRKYPNAKPQEARGQTMIFRIVTKHGMTIDVSNTPADFSISVVWANIKLTGQFQNDNLVIPIDSISFMTYGDVAVREGNAPTVETKQ